MKIYNMEKGVRPQDVFSSFFPLYSILNIIGLSSVYRAKATSGNVICCYMRICLRPSDGTFTAIVKMFHLVGNFQYLVDVYFVHKYGRQSFIDYISVYQHIDNSLGRTCYNQIRGSLRKISLFMLVISVAVFVFNATSSFISIGGIMSVVIVLEYVFYFFEVLNTLDMITNATQVKYRLKIIADLLKDLYNHTDYMSGVYQNVGSKVFVTNNENHIDTRKFTSDNYSTIMGLSKCYLLLIKQCNYINNMYGFRILTHNFIFVIDVIMLLNFIIRLIFGSVVLEHSWLPIIATAAGVVAFCTVFHCGVYSCEQSYRQTERITFWTENLLINKKLSPELQDALKELKSLIHLKPISFHVLHFYKIEYSTIMSIASAVVTYTIIFLQNVS